MYFNYIALNIFHDSLKFPHVADLNFFLFKLQINIIGGGDTFLNFLGRFTLLKFWVLKEKMHILYFNIKSLKQTLITVALHLIKNFAYLISDFKD